MLICVWVYGQKTVELAKSRGWNTAYAHGIALADENEIVIARTHPFNYLSEEEVEEWERNAKIRKEAIQSMAVDGAKT